MDEGASTLEDLTSGATGSHAISGAGASTLEALASIGGVIIGAAASTLEDLASDTQAGSYEPVTGDINSHLAALTSSGAGLCFEPPWGLSAIALEALAGSGVGHHRFGTSAAILEALAGSGVGAYLVTGDATPSLPDMSSHGFGTAYMARRVRQLALTGTTKPTKALNGTMRI